MDLWRTLKPGTVFVFDARPYLRVHGYTGILALDDFAHVTLHDDVRVQPVGSIAVSPGLVEFVNLECLTSGTIH